MTSLLLVTETTQSERKHGGRSEHEQKKIFDVNNKFEFCFICLNLYKNTF